MACGKRDSAIIYSQRIIDNGKDQNNMYDAAKQLFRLYEEQGDVVNAHRYAVLYMQLSDTLDFGRRQGKLPRSPTPTSTTWTKRRKWN